MNAASALASGPAAVPALAEAAVNRALAKAELLRASGVFLLLTAGFSRQAEAAVLAAARAAGSMQVFGMIAAGLMTEEGWSLDQPAAAALVLGQGLELAAPGEKEASCLGFATGDTLPDAWRKPPERYGLLHPGRAWQQGRLAERGQSSVAVHGARCRAALSTGLQELTAPLAVESVRGYDLCRLGGQEAAHSLLRALPPALREAPELPLHRIYAVRAEGGPAIPILAVNADASLTLGEVLCAGERLAWASRQTLGTERNMADSLTGPAPDFALMFSCIGRGPLFYGGDDLDWRAFRRRFPGVPLLGAYGSGQIHPFAGENRQFQNCVVTFLCGNAHV